MQNSYIVRLKNNDLMCFYYIKDKGILYRLYEAGEWSEENTLIKSGRQNYTIALDDVGNIYILCQNGYGDVLLYLNQDSVYTKWTEKTILKNKSQKVYPITLYPMLGEKGMGLLYNVPIVDEKSNHLVRQTFNERGKWSLANKIDKLISLPNYIFQVQPVTPKHILVFYQTNVHEYSLGYREMTPDGHSKFNIFLNTSHKIADTSFLTTNDSVHILYIVRGSYMSQLIYRKKEEGEFSSPVLLCEGEFIENCLFFFVGGGLHVVYMNDGQLYHCISENGGDSFSRPTRYYSKICKHPVKASYISYYQGNADKYYARELYVDSDEPWNIQIIPDMCNDFYPPATVKEAAALVRESGERFHADDYNDLKKKITSLQKELAEKEKEVISLNSLVAAKNEEISQLDFLRKESQRRFLIRMEELEKEIESAAVKEEALDE